MQVFMYIISRVIYISYFHPASRFPGPRLASISNLWLAYYQYVLDFEQKNHRKQLEIYLT